MKVKEVMERGIKVAPEKPRGMYFGIDGTSACAMGTLALGLDPKPTYAFEVNKAFPFLNERLSRYPEARNALAIEATGNSFIESIIVILNDTHDVSREAIAEWLSLVEKEHACQARP